MLHLDERDARDRLQQVARGLVVALGAAHVAAVVEGQRLVDLVVEDERAVGDLLRNQLRVVLHLEVVFVATLRCEVGVELLPHQTARGAGGDDGLHAAFPHLGGVVQVDLLEDVPLAGDLHGDAAAGLVGAEHGEFDAGLVEQAHRRFRDVGVHIARRAAREVGHGRALEDLRGDVFGHPVHALLALAGPDVVLAAQGGGNHLERREGHAALVVDELAAHRHPRVLDWQLQLATRVADLAGRADQELVDHLLVELLASLHHVAQVEVLAARGVAHPTASRVLLARVDAVAALGAGVGVVGDVLRDALALLERDGRRGLHQVGHGTDERLERRGEAHHQVDDAAAEHLVRVHETGRIRSVLEVLQAADAVLAEHRRRLTAEVEAGRVRSAAVALGDGDDREGEREGRVEGEGASVVRDEAQQHDVVALAEHALEHERLTDLGVDLLEHRGQRRQRDDDLGRDDRGPDALQAHGGEALLPFMLRGLGGQLGTAVGQDDRVELRADRILP